MSQQTLLPAGGNGPPPDTAYVPPKRPHGGQSAPPPAPRPPPTPGYQQGPLGVEMQRVQHPNMGGIEVTPQAAHWYQGENIQQSTTSADQENLAVNANFNANPSGYPSHLHNTSRRQYDQTASSDPTSSIVSITPQRNYRNALDFRSLRLKWPNLFQRHEIAYDSRLDSNLHQNIFVYKDGHGPFRGVDILGRVHSGPDDDRYISPYDGHLAKLVVQCTDAIWDGPTKNVTHRRTFIRNRGPLILRIANWALRNVNNANDDPARAALCWLPACGGIFITLFYIGTYAAEVRHNGFYDPFLYKFWLYPKVARNCMEDDNNPQRQLERTAKRNESAPKPLGTDRRLLRPPRLMFLNYPEHRDRLYGATLQTIEKYEEDNGKITNLRYAFVAFTFEHFNIAGDDRNQEHEFALHRIAEGVALSTGCQAYFTSHSCLSKNIDIAETEVNMISDIIRGASAVAIAIRDPKANSDANPISHVRRVELLREWGSRMWTFPEILLSSHNEFAVWGADQFVEDPSQEHVEPSQRQALKVPSKPSFTFGMLDAPELIWDDPYDSRQLVDHFQGSAILSNLELLSLGVKCLGIRKYGEHLPGDLSYVLMGLLRLRPTVDKTDSKFQAFARLSLGNNSDKLLERLVSMWPKAPVSSGAPLPVPPRPLSQVRGTTSPSVTTQDWISATDRWGVNLWDIDPMCQVAGIGNDDTVILDGCFAAAIRWKAFARVATLTKIAWKRTISRYLLRNSAYVLLVGIILTATLKSTFLFSLAIIVLLVGLINILLSPFLVRTIYGGKVWNTQAWFQGFEGYMDIGTIEACIWGNSIGRLQWSTSGSDLSRHVRNQFDECVGIDPTTDLKTKDLVSDARMSGLGGTKVYTLVDTYTMTVTMFAAARPPVSVIVCGSEGGMLRTVLCSLDWKTGTLYREAVLRMETPVIEKMFRVKRFRFGFNRTVPKVRERNPC